jgi:hypothetical protein
MQYKTENNLSQLVWGEKYSLPEFKENAPDNTSSLLTVTSGVPQGSILGPMLFLFYINDLPDYVSPETVCALFADDAKCYKEISTERDCLYLQRDINNLLLWSTKWDMNFNISKCKLLSITRKRKPFVFNYTMGDNHIDRVDSMCDLGVEVTSNLTWDLHINNIVKKSNRMLGLIQRTCGQSCSTQTKRNLYLALVRTSLDYSTQSWSVCTKKSLLRLEGVQRRASKYIIGYSQCGGLDYKDRLSILNLLPLSYRREISDCVFLFKCIHGDLDLKIHSFVQFKSGETLNLKLPRFRSESFRLSYFNRIFYSWNDCLVKDLSSASVYSFKRILINHYINLFNNKFVTGDTCTWLNHCFCPQCRMA